MDMSVLQPQICVQKITSVLQLRLVWYVMTRVNVEITVSAYQKHRLVMTNDYIRYIDKNNDAVK